VQQTKHSLESQGPGISKEPGEVLGWMGSTPVGELFGLFGSQFLDF
jgi:hypothetical protein